MSLAISIKYRVMVISLFASTSSGFGFLQFDETNNLFYATVFSGSAIISLQWMAL